MASTGDKQQLLRQLPKVDRLVADEALSEARERLGEEAVTRMVRAAVAEARTQALVDGMPPRSEDVLAAVVSRVQTLLGSRAVRVINATGVLLHTNLGRAPLGLAAADALRDSARGYTSIELDMASGRRGRRGAFAETALAHLSGAEDACVVNNCAAAVLLVLAAIAAGRGVVVSRGEQVEIGGGFRVPEVLAKSGGKMIEVGTTNKTKLSDYARAMDEHDVACILRVHQSNFRQIGFVERPALADLAELAHSRDVLLVKDLGGGALFDFAPLGLAGEPDVKSCVQAGADLVCFSGDKLLGGPQAGIVVGRRDLVQRVRRDPLARALRAGRLPLVALEATLAAYLSGDTEAVPVLAAIRRPLSVVRARVERWCRVLADHGLAVEARSSEAAVGGGTLAERPLGSFAAVLTCERVEAVARRLRGGSPAVLARIQDEAVWLDGRSVLADEEDEMLAAVVRAVTAE